MPVNRKELDDLIRRAGLSDSVAADLRAANEDDEGEGDSPKGHGPAEQPLFHLSGF